MLLKGWFYSLLFKSTANILKIICLIIFTSHPLGFFLPFFFTFLFPSFLSHIICTKTRPRSLVLILLQSPWSIGKLFNLHDSHLTPVLEERTEDLNLVANGDRRTIRWHSTLLWISCDFSWPAILFNKNKEPWPIVCIIKVWTQKSVEDFSRPWARPFPVFFGPVTPSVCHVFFPSLQSYHPLKFPVFIFNVSYVRKAHNTWQFSSGFFRVGDNCL